MTPSLPAQPIPKRTLRLITPMLERFIATDRGFAKARMENKVK
ncbi:DUF2274 domain-containing protein [Xanthobacter autotrophicus]